MTKSLVAPLESAQIHSAGTNDAWIELIGDTGITQTLYSVFHTTDCGKSWNTVIANSTAGGGPAPGFSQDVKKNLSIKGRNLNLFMWSIPNYLLWVDHALPTKIKTLSDERKMP